MELLHTFLVSLTGADSAEVGNGCIKKVALGRGQLARLVRA